MPEEGFWAFIAQLKGDKVLQEKLISAQAADHIVEIGMQRGRRFSVDNVKKLCLTIMSLRW